MGLCGNFTRVFDLKFCSTTYEGSFTWIQFLWNCNRTDCCKYQKMNSRHVIIILRLWTISSQIQQTYLGPTLKKRPYQRDSWIEQNKNNKNSKNFQVLWKKVDFECSCSRACKLTIHVVWCPVKSYWASVKFYLQEICSSTCVAGTELLKEPASSGETTSWYAGGAEAAILVV